MSVLMKFYALLGWFLYVVCKIIAWLLSKVATILAISLSYLQVVFN